MIRKNGIVLCDVNIHFSKSSISPNIFSPNHPVANRLVRHSIPYPTSGNDLCLPFCLILILCFILGIYSTVHCDIYSTLWLLQYKMTTLTVHCGIYSTLVHYVIYVTVAFSNILTKIENILTH